MKCLLLLTAVALVLGSHAFAVCPPNDGFGIVEPVNSEASPGNVYECVTTSKHGMQGAPARNRCSLLARNLAVKNCNDMYIVPGLCDLNTDCYEVPGQ